MTRIVLCLLLLAAGHQVAADKAQPVTLETFMRRAGYYPVRLQERDLKLHAEGTINGTKAQMLVDSGWSITAVSHRHAKELPSLGTLGKRVKDSFLGELSHTNWHVVSQLGLGEAFFLNQPVQVRDLKIGSHQEHAAVLGCDFLFRNHCVLDPGGLTLFVRGTNPPPQVEAALVGSLRQSGFVEVPLTVSEQMVFRIEAEISGSPVQLAVDTGSFFNTLDREVARRLKLKTKPTSLAVRGVDRRGTDKVNHARVESFRLGGVEFGRTDILVFEHEDWGIGEESTHAHDFEGLLGLPWMLQQRVILDYHGKRMWLVPDVDRR